MAAFKPGNDQSPEPTLDERIAERRADKDFQARLARVMEQDREAFELLAQNDEEQPDQ
jgi:hypothetical protein